MKYEDVKTPEQLLKYMNENIRYGFIDDNEKEYGLCNIEQSQKNSKKKWKLSSPERLIKVKYGQCLDQVELERKWFEKHGYKIKTLFIWFELPYDNTYSIHAYLIFEDSGKYYYFEHANSNNRGIYEFSTYKDAINYQRKKHIENNKQRNHVGDKELKCLYIYEYDRPVYGCTLKEFIDYILLNAKRIEI